MTISAVFTFVWGLFCGFVGFNLSRNAKDLPDKILRLLTIYFVAMVGSLCIWWIFQ